MSYSGSTEAPEAPPAKQPRSLLTAAEGQAARDSDGLVQQRQRPLKINLDLALVGYGLGGLGLGAAVHDSTCASEEGLYRTARPS